MERAAYTELRTFQTSIVTQSAAHRPFTIIPVRFPTGYDERLMAWPTSLIANPCSRRTDEVFEELIYVSQECSGKILCTEARARSFTVPFYRVGNPTTVQGKVE